MRREQGREARPPFNSYFISEAADWHSEKFRGTALSCDREYRPNLPTQPGPAAALAEKRPLEAAEICYRAKNSQDRPWRPAIKKWAPGRRHASARAKRI